MDLPAHLVVPHGTSPRPNSPAVNKNTSETNLDVEETR
ncbi:hypothetical protein L843_1007 [Mycobacterium intracellulare MIN_061107_1834]|nr:hypothetical protein L843_1007 [Mycobacterium intracellulare MIN_061107_1834]